MNICKAGSSLTSVLRKTDGQRRFLDFLLEQIFFVEKEDDGRIGEPLVVADGVKQLQTLLHTVLQPITRRLTLLRIQEENTGNSGSISSTSMKHSHKYLPYVTGLKRRL